MRIAPLNLKVLACILDVEGFDSRPVLRHCGIDSTDDVDEGGDWLPVDLFDRMMAAVIEVTQDEAFGLVAGKSIALMRYGAITPLVLSTPSLRQMLDDVWRFGVLALERAEVALVEVGQAGPGAHILVQPVVRGGLSGRFRTEQIATSVVQMLRYAGAGLDDIVEVDFPYPRPDEFMPRYQVTFGPRLRFDRPTCAVHFNPALLDARLPAHDPVAYLSARTRAEALLSAMQAGSDAAELVRQWLLAALPRQPGVAETAGHLGLNERAYRRQLALLGTSHAELAQACQQLAAKRLLAEGHQPLKQIADALGFASVHSFHRAFRRWSGVTPSAWRAGGRESRSLPPEA
jgi:AraC-like DNA-binding protein